MVRYLVKTSRVTVKPPLGLTCHQGEIIVIEVAIWILMGISNLLVREIVTFLFSSPWYLWANTGGSLIAEWTTSNLGWWFNITTCWVNSHWSQAVTGTLDILYLWRIYWWLRFLGFMGNLNMKHDYSWLFFFFFVPYLNHTPISVLINWVDGVIFFFKKVTS